jgi:O-acetyl-ADP-ribose deacetylase (regulator of RNase III)
MLGGCQTGEAKITPGFRLPARWVIHTVGPIWNGGDKASRSFWPVLLRRSLEMRPDKGFETIAFPAISTGVYRFPADLAAEIAVTTVDRPSRPTEPTKR